jgi:Ca2+/H+ antiporter, TMEM165/GDT1 family
LRIPTRFGGQYGAANPLLLYPECCAPSDRDASGMILTLALAAVPAFVASLVEWVEAFTIVLAVGNTRGWRSPIWGTLAGLGTLAVIVAIFGTPLVIFQEQVSQSFHVVIGILLLLFGMRWLRKAILRFAGIVALHDEELIYQREVAELRGRGVSPSRWDNIGFWFSYKAVLLEGLEVAFIVIALGAQGGAALQAAIVGAVAAFVVTTVAGALLHRPLAFVPENFMKFLVGAMLTTFGIFWGAEGLLVHWPLDAASLPVILGGVCLVSLLALRMLAVIAPHGARVAVRNI